MIAALSGRVLSKGVDRAVIDVSGVGYEVCLTTENDFPVAGTRGGDFSPGSYSCT